MGEVHCLKEEKTPHQESSRAKQASEHVKQGNTKLTKYMAKQNLWGDNAVKMA